jgi:hypothetical protein
LRSAQPGNFIALQKMQRPAHASNSVNLSKTNSKLAVSRRRISRKIILDIAVGFCPRCLTDAVFDPRRSDAAKKRRPDDAAPASVLAYSRQVPSRPNDFGD